MTPKIDKRLNIVLEVDRPGTHSFFVHSMPITRAVYKQHSVLFAQTISYIYQKNIGAGVCARIALDAMRDMVKKEDAAAGPDVMTGQNEVEKLVLPMIWQRTNVVVPTEQGWQQIPFDEVVQRQLIDEDDLDEVENYLVFFTVASWTHAYAQLKASIYPIWENSGARLTSQNSTEYMRSLPTLKPAGTTNGSPVATASLPLV